MIAAERREKIEHLLRAAQDPLSASSIAAHFTVSRQVIVGDIALMRASGLDILATPRGYVLRRQESDAAYFERSLACVHSMDGLADELYTAIDNGGWMIDVTVSHAVYGEICAPLYLYSRADIDAFLKKLRHTNPLSALTNGVHLHRIRCADEATFLRVEKALREKGFLFEKSAE